jgi:two-component system response regulator
MRDISYLLGKAIRARRNKLGLSQEELAFRSKLHRTYVAHVERGGRNPSLKSIAKLANALHLPFSELLVDIRTASEHERGLKDRPAVEQVVEILLVEDNADDAELAIRALKKCNFANHIHLARDGQEAFEFIFCTGIFAKRRMDLGTYIILLDLALPKLGGLEVLRRLRSDSRTKTIPVIVLTASRGEKDLDECRKLGVKDYIIKPVDFEKFSVTVPRLGLHWLLTHQPAQNAAVGHRGRHGE